jgi:hypothetical protein
VADLVVEVAGELLVEVLELQGKETQEEGQKLKTLTVLLQVAVVVPEQVEELVLLAVLLVQVVVDHLQV